MRTVGSHGCCEMALHHHSFFGKILCPPLCFLVFSQKFFFVFFFFWFLFHISFVSLTWDLRFALIFEYCVGLKKWLNLI